MSPVCARVYVPTTHMIRVKHRSDENKRERRAIFILQFPRVRKKMTGRDGDSASRHHDSRETKRKQERECADRKKNLDTMSPMSIGLQISRSRVIQEGSIVRLEYQRERELDGRNKTPFDYRLVERKREREREKRHLPEIKFHDLRREKVYRFCSRRSSIFTRLFVW